MKKIKSYQQFESLKIAREDLLDLGDNLFSDLIDICRELTDEPLSGGEVKCECDRLYGIAIYTFKFNFPEATYWMEIKPTILRMIEVIERNGSNGQAYGYWGTSLSSFKRFSKVDLEKLKDFEEYWYISNLELYIKPEGMT
jgi:hypothetical protein